MELDLSCEISVTPKETPRVAVDIRNAVTHSKSRARKQRYSRPERAARWQLLGGHPNLGRGEDNGAAGASSSRHISEEDWMLTSALPLEYDMRHCLSIGVS